MQKTLLFICLLINCNLFSQEFRKDLRTQQQRDDSHNEYQADLISKVELLKALDFQGIRIFKFPLDSFDKEYKLTVQLDEYIDGKVISSRNINLLEKNTYTHVVDSGIKDAGDILYTDYIDQLLFYIKSENDIIQTIKFETYAGSDRLSFRTPTTRKFQHYTWRHYSKTKWVLNKKIPLLVCASSWYDPKNEVERFCGVADLSADEKGTRELLQSSPHYFVISYKVSLI